MLTATANNARSDYYSRTLEQVSRVPSNIYIYYIMIAARCSMDDSLLGQYLRLETPVGPVTRRGLFLRVIDKPRVSRRERMCVRVCIVAEGSSVRVDDDDREG